MRQGTLRYEMQENLHCREISQRRISKMLRKVAPRTHRERAHDLLDRTNPVPYHASYFGYKLHMDQNEKIAQEYGVTHVHALDGCSRMVLGFITIPKNNRCSYTNIYLGKDPINFMPRMLVSRTLKKAYWEIQKPIKVLYTVTLCNLLLCCKKKANQV